MRSIIAAMALAACASAGAAGSLSSDIRITSEALGYDLSYRVYLPQGDDTPAGLPTLYVTDGQGYISRGEMPQVLDRLIADGRIDSVVVVFVDPRDPDNARVNRRNQQFFCNEDYLDFYRRELVPTVERDYATANRQSARSILGVSFGGLNAACFGLDGHDTFSGIAMHSPANHPVPDLLDRYEVSDRLPLRIFLSTGQPNDNTRANRAFRDVLEAKGYPLEYIEVRQGHDWRNWRPLVDDVLLYFYSPMD